tara:strand:- start:2584 stop:3507 length:924 start_codon:yes stop_codon:yes gene_type:complete
MVDNTIPPTMAQGGVGVPMGQPQVNPLKKHLRQPKIYIKLPSQGKYWPQNSIDIPETGEFPVYAMTARDEITFKTPDALLNGQATVDVIQSCVPNIKNAWMTPSIDLDTLLIAIRMATYGETIEISTQVPNTQSTRDFGYSLQNIYDHLQSAKFETTHKITGFTVVIKPITYKVQTEQATKAFEEQRVFSIIDNDDIDQSVKLAKFQQAFQKLTDININVLIDSVVSIQPDGDPDAVTNPAYLKDFLDNCEASVFNEISACIKAQKEAFAIKPVTIQSDEEEIKAGAPETFEVPITFDQSNFFGSGS